MYISLRKIEDYVKLHEQPSITQRHYHYSSELIKMGPRLPKNDWNTLHYERGDKDVGNRH